MRKFYEKIGRKKILRFNCFVDRNLIDDVEKFYYREKFLFLSAFLCTNKKNINY